MSRKWLFVALGLIVGWHLFLWVTAASEVCIDPPACTGVLESSINPLTDHVVLTLREVRLQREYTHLPRVDGTAPMPSPSAPEGETPKIPDGAFKTGLQMGASWAAERKFNDAAHQYFDLYAMVFTYTVSVEI
jgi:hypothetical protein